jgi:ADP-ribosyl-[dinitrogen reductase] hydrolase
VRDFVDRPVHGLRRGWVTDDTEMAFLVARSLLVKENLDLLDVAARLMAWADGGGAAGPSTSRAVAALRRGIEPRRAGSREAPSSGCLPRCAPVGLAVPIWSVVDLTVACCELTHRHPDAVAATIALNLLLSHLVESAEWVRAIEAVKDHTGRSSPASAVWEPQQGSGAGPIFAEAVAHVDTAGDAEEAMVSAVSAGGDTDTRGAIAGALAGARWGSEALPERWVAACEAASEARYIGRSLGSLRLKQGNWQVHL